MSGVAVGAAAEPLGGRPLAVVQKPPDPAALVLGNSEPSVTAGVISGADVQTDSDVEIINKDHVLCTLTDNVPFMMEMVVENGRG